MARTQKQIIGKWGEEQAALFLTKHNYDVADKNYCLYTQGKKAGEVDIIAWHDKPHFGRTLCFVEVKTRTSGDGSAERATNRRQKLSAFLKTARCYCLDKKIDIDAIPIQFEQVSVYLDRRSGVATFRKYEIPID